MTRDEKDGGRVRALAPVPGGQLPAELNQPVKHRITAVMLGCIFFAGILTFRSMMLQVIDNPRLEQMARRQFQSKVLIRPRRGSIVDRNGEPLAINTETNSLAANPMKVQNKRTLAKLLAKAMELPYSKVLQRLNESKEFVWIKRQIPESEMAQLKHWHIIDASGDLVSGLWLVKESQRRYPHQELAAHLLGSVNVDSEGLEGTELWFNEQLSGKVVSVTGIKDALGRPTFLDAQAARNGKDGETVNLTIDASLQFAVEEELKNAVHRTGARSGTVIVMNSVTGELLAIANQPAFNPNHKGVPAERRRNRALTDGYEPGSTMKAVLLATALSHGWKLTDQIWAENGTFKVQGKRISEAEAHEKFEWLNLKDIIKFSSNVGAAKLALKVGADAYFNSLRNFGFGLKTGVGFPGEIAGKVPARKSWQPLALANIGFGQGVLVTPLQMIRAYAAFQNGGWLVQPTLIKRDPLVAAKDGLKDLRTEPPRRIFSQRVADQVLETLHAVTEDGGTGTKARLEGYTVGGKTGTAQVVDSSTGTYSRTRYVASFIGFPLQIDPKIVIFTSLDEPKGIYYASETAAPLFRGVLAAVANRFSLPAKAEPMLASAKKLLNSGQASIPRPDSVASKSDLSSQHDQLKLTQAKTLQPDMAPIGSHPDGRMIWKMPSLKGLSPREAMHLLGGHPFHVEVRGIGIIKSQHPEEGANLSDGGMIRLSLGEP